MASSTLSTYNSSLVTDPLRGFRFTASFTTAGGGDPFDGRIIDANGTVTPPSSGKSTGWVGGFSSIGGLSINTQNIQYREGGYNTTVHQIPGMTTFTPVTFSRGVLFGNDQALAWMRGLFSAAQGSGLNNSLSANAPSFSGGNFRVDIVISVNDHPNTNANKDVPKMKFKIHNAWITSLNYTDLDATNGALLFETMQLVHEGISAYFVKGDGTPTDLSNENLY
jgi:phage tail-like protein